jgi:hypothetical protein
MILIESWTVNKQRKVGDCIHTVDYILFDSVKTSPFLLFVSGQTLD